MQDANLRVFSTLQPSSPAVYILCLDWPGMTLIWHVSFQMSRSSVLPLRGPGGSLWIGGFPCFMPPFHSCQKSRCQLFSFLWAGLLKASKKQNKNDNLTVVFLLWVEKRKLSRTLTCLILFEKTKFHHSTTELEKKTRFYLAVHYIMIIRGKSRDGMRCWKFHTN